MKKANRGTVRKIFATLRPYYPLLILSLLFATAVVLLTLYIPIAVGDAIDLESARGLSILTASSPSS